MLHAPFPEPAPVDLNQYLEEARDEGEVVDEGSFTLERSRALEKLASFSLPFDSAWAVKVVQAAVSSGSVGPVVVKLGGKETVFTFPENQAWSLEEIEMAFYNPESSDNPHLNHLKCALWFTGIAGRRAFQIDLPGCTEALVWNGRRLRRVEALGDTQDFRLAVTPLGVGAVNAPWVGRKLLTSERNLEVQQALGRYCCVCPLPLRVDGKRVDGLELLPERGWGESVLPMCLLPGEADIRELSIPPGTLERGGQSAALSGSSVVTMISAMLLKAEGGWQGRRVPSVYAWVKDGALIQQENCPVVSTTCTATLFLSADGMETDLTGFQLLIGHEKERRAAEALKAASRSVHVLVPYSKESVRDKENSSMGVLGLVLVAVGVGTAPITLGLGSAFVTAGFVGAVLDRSRKANFKKWLAGEYDQLALNFGQVAASLSIRSTR